MASGRQRKSKEEAKAALQHDTDLAGKRRRSQADDRRVEKRPRVRAASCTRQNFRNQPIVTIY